MNADEKIKEAQFFLQKLKKYEFHMSVNDYYLNAFISSADSIPEYLLEDYQKAYLFHISLKERDLKKQFLEKACKNAVKGDLTALKFFQWYKERTKYIESSDQVGKVLSNHRNITIHREPTRPIIQLVTRDKSDSTSPSREPKIIILCLPNMSMVEACKKFLILMENLVSEAHSKFPHELFDVKF